MMSELNHALQWRYATKKMNGQGVPAEKLDRILEAIRLAPSSFGLQPYHVTVVADRAVRSRIHESACVQPQVVEGSHLLVFAHWADIQDQQVDAYINNIAETRGVSVASLEGFARSIKSSMQNKTLEQRQQWAARQVYIGLGYGLVAAALEQVDATPMEGFEPAIMDEVLQLSEQGLKSVVLLALGYRDEARDSLASAPKVRRSKAQFFTIL